MSQENVEIVRRGFEAFARDSLQAVLEFADPEVELLTPFIPGAQHFHGRDGVVQALQDWFEVFETWELVPEELIDAGDEVVAVVRHHARGRESGAEIEARSAWIFRLRAGKTVQLCVYNDRAEALEAVGLSG